MRDLAGAVFVFAVVASDADPGGPDAGPGPGDEPAAANLQSVAVAAAAGGSASPGFSETGEHSREAAASGAAPLPADRGGAIAAAQYLLRLPQPAAAPSQAAVEPSTLPGAAAAAPAPEHGPDPDPAAAPVQPRPASAAGHGLVINVSFDPSVAKAPAGFVAAFEAAVQFYEAAFANPVTINIDVGWGEIDGQTLPGGFVGASEPVNSAAFGYSAVRNALLATAAGIGDQIAVASLPAIDPTAGASFFMSTAEAKAMGLPAGDDPAIDGWIGFGSSFQYAFDPNNRAQFGAYDFIATAEHEIAEVLGRFSGEQTGAGLTPLDLFRYQAPEVRALFPSSAYFSIDDGATAINTFNFGNGGDFGDWAGSAPDAFDAFLPVGKELPLSPGDLLLMSALGYQPATLIQPPPPMPTGVALAPGSDSSGGENVTNVTTPVVDGAGAPGELVILYDGTAIVGRGVVGDNGSWSLTTSVLPQGQNLLTAVESDVFGNTSAASAPLAVTIKSSAAPPSAPMLAGGGTATATATPTLAGTGEAGDWVQVYDSGTLVGSGVVDAAGSWALTTLPLPQGVNLLTATETDLAGNLSPASAPLALTVAGNVFAGSYANGLVLAYPALQNPATVTATGSVTAAPGGSGVYGTGAAAWSFVNDGTIAGGFLGVDLSAGGTIVNSGTIAGTYGAVIHAGDGVGATIANSGTIIGSGGTAVLFGGGDDRLIVDPGAVFDGAAVADGGGTLELAAGGGAGTLDGLGAAFAGFAGLVVDVGALWQLGGDAGGMRVTNDGTIAVGSGDSLILGATGEDRGAHGAIALAAGATLVFSAGAARGQEVLFEGKRGLLQLDRAARFKASIAGFAAGDTIDLVGRKADGFTYAQGALTLTEHGRTVATLAFVGHYRAADFLLASDGHGGTDITLAAPIAAAFAIGAPAPADMLAGPDPPLWVVPA